MSSFDQAFVQAFARRNRSAGKQVAANPAAVQQAESAPTINPGDEPGSLKVDHSVASSAQVWVDPIEDQIARADVANPAVPKPHIDPIGDPVTTHRSTLDEQTASSLQHIHTAYATAFADVTVAPIQPTQAEEVEPVPTVEEPPAQNPIVDHPQDVEQRAPVGVSDVRIDPPAVSANEPHTITPIQAVWEVDVFDVPATVADLFFEGNLFQQIAKRMSDAVNTGLRSILLTSTKAGEGRSSVAIGFAMAAAAAGIRVALVDADTEDPTLADDLRLQLEYGWVDTVRGGLPIKEVAVHAVEDGVTLIPLMPPHGRTAATGFEIVQLAELLKNKFELVVIDGPAGNSPNIHQCASVVDSAVIVRDASRTDTLAINEFSYRLRESGAQGVGVVENFV
jgi:Mrp family chromosome partitioning ATPase